MLKSLLPKDCSDVGIPTVYFDTQIFSQVRDGIIPRDSWLRVTDYVQRNAHHGISLISLYELIAAIAAGSDSHFVRNRERLRLMRFTGNETLLPLVGDFLRAHLFAKPYRRIDFDPNALRVWIPVMLRAQTRQQLIGADVVFNSAEDLRFGLDLRMVQYQVLRGKAGYIRRLKHLRKMPSNEPTLDAWAEGYLGNIEVEKTPENVRVIKSALDAAYRHDLWVRSRSRDPKYNFKKHQSDWLDSQQLHYLAERTFIFITNDAPLRGAIHDSPEANRVISYDRLEEMSIT